MTKGHELKCYDYINHPYADVRDALLADPLSIFERATGSAAARANALGAELRARVASVDVSAEVTIHILKVVESRSAEDRPGTEIELTWRATNRPGLFPVMAAKLSLYPLTPRETQLELRGMYTPPLGILGQAIDAVALHKIAEVSVQRFTSDVASFLRRELPDEPGPGDTFLFTTTD